MMPSGVEHGRGGVSPYLDVCALPSMMPSGVEHHVLCMHVDQVHARATFYDAFGR